MEHLINNLIKKKVIKMANGKFLALLGGIVTLIGTFFFSLFTSGALYNYGIMGAVGVLDAISGSGVEGVVFSIIYILYLLSFMLILIGIKSRIFAIIGSILPIAGMVFVILGAFGVWTYPINWLGNAIGGGGMGPLVPGIIPVSFDALLLPGSYSTIDLGTWIVGLGGLLALVSGFISREN